MVASPSAFVVSTSSATEIIAFSIGFASLSVMLNVTVKTGVSDSSTSASAPETVSVLFLLRYDSAETV